MVEHVLAKDETGVRFSYTAQIPIQMELKTQNLIDKIPSYVSYVTKTLNEAGFEAF